MMVPGVVKSSLGISSEEEHLELSAAVAELLLALYSLY